MKTLLKSIAASAILLGMSSCCAYLTSWALREAAKPMPTFTTHGASANHNAFGLPAAQHIRFMSHGARLTVSHHVRRT